MTQLVYIGGYGRSGSTLLEMLMTKDPDVVGCGETVGALRPWNKDRRCSCGRSPYECPVWAPLLAAMESRQGWRHEELDAALRRIVSPGHSIMVDSSKTVWSDALSPFRLRRASGEDFRLVHLVRDPRAVCWSITKDEIRRADREGGRVKMLRRCFVGATGWITANLACEFFGQLYPGQYLRLRYEDLAQSPKVVLEDLFRTLWPGHPVDFSRESDSDNRHQLFGNRVRRTSISLADVRLDDAWKAQLPKSCRRLTEILSGALRRRYGYI